MSDHDEACCAPGCCSDQQVQTTTIAGRAKQVQGSAVSAARAAVVSSGAAAELSPSSAPVPHAPAGGEALRATVREKYAQAARRAVEGNAPSCGCGTSCCGGDGEVWDPITTDLYEAGEVEGIPATALLASLGCGNPTALAELSPGEVVLDLGSGGGIDVLLSARRVGPGGKAYGLDMTDDMLALARDNQAKAGANNVEFLKGEIEHIPLPDASVDVIISNCVINLSADKPQVMREAFRVLRPGGRLAVSDVVLRGELPSEVQRSVALFTGCVSGALEEGDYAALLARAGFRDIGIEPTRVYTAADARALIESAGLDAESLIPAVEGKVMSAFVRARKPAR
ncbi:MAG: arsenite methyltransferase [Gemmatimonadaceae bacterium]|nr:arsenite methyltransferase [Gemmatimonadaceae bacterium]